MHRPSLSLGIEEEYQIIDPETRELRSFITQFIEDGKVVMVERELKPELHQSHGGAGHARLRERGAAARGTGQAALVGCANWPRTRDSAVVAAATHPFSR